MICDICGKDCRTHNVCYMTPRGAVRTIGFFCPECLDKLVMKIGEIKQEVAA